MYYFQPRSLSVLMRRMSYYRIADSRSAPKDGAYVHGLLMEGARWDCQAGIIMDSRLKELFPPMPVINVRVRPYFEYEGFFCMVAYRSLNSRSWTVSFVNESDSFLRYKSVPLGCTFVTHILYIMTENCLVIRSQMILFMNTFKVQRY